MQYKNTLFWELCLCPAISEPLNKYPLKICWLWSSTVIIYAVVHIIALLSYNCFAGSPCNTFEFIISPLFRSLGYAVPRVTLDTSAALAISRIFLFISTLFYPWLDSKWMPQPLILPAEVYKVRVSDSYSILVFSFVLPVCLIQYNLK